MVVVGKRRCFVPLFLRLAPQQIGVLNAFVATGNIVTMLFALRRFEPVAAVAEAVSRMLLAMTHLTAGRLDDMDQPIEDIGDFMISGGPPPHAIDKLADGRDFAVRQRLVETFMVVVLFHIPLTDSRPEKRSGTFLCCVFH